MATRKLEVQIIGDDKSLQRALGRAGLATGKFGSATAKMKRGVAIAGAGIAVALGYAVKSAASFETQLSSLQAVSGANTKQMAAFRKQAMLTGLTTVFSAKDAAVALTELSKGGIGVADMSKALKGTLAMASAGEMELGDAATTVANALNLFGLKGGAATHVADALATAANATTADVSDFAMALSQGGAAAKQAGMSFDQTIVSLEMLAKSGVKNSDAGTSLKTTLIHLAKPTKQARGLMDDLNLSFFNSHGKIKNVADIGAMLQKRLGGMTKEQRLATFATIAGTDGMRTLAAFYDGGSKAAGKFAEGVKKQGTAAQVAATKNNNLQGHLKSLKNIINVGAIAVGSKLIPALDSVARSVSGFVSGMIQGSGAGGRFADKVRSIAAAASSAVGWLKKNRDAATAIGAALAGLVAGVATYKALTAATKLWAAASKAAALAAAANPYILVAVALVALGAAFVVAYKRSTEFRNIVNRAVGDVRKVISAFVAYAKPAFTVAFAFIKATVTHQIAAVVAVLRGMAGVVRGVANVIDGVIHGDFSQAWTGMKQIVSGVVGMVSGMLRGVLAPLHGVGAAASAMAGMVGGAFRRMVGAVAKGISTILGLFSSMLSGLAKVVGGMSKLPLIGGAFKSVAGKVRDAAAAVDSLRAKIDGLHDKNVNINVRTFNNAPQGGTSGSGGHKIAQGARARHVIFGDDVDIAAAGRQREAMQAQFDRSDRRAQLAAARNKAAHAKSAADRAEGRKELAALRKEFSRTDKLARIDLKIKGLEQVKAFKGALASIRSTLTEKIASAVEVFKQQWEKTSGKAFDKETNARLDAFDTQTQALVEGTDAYKALKAEQDAADADATRAEDDRLAKQLADAQASGDKQAIDDAQREIDDVARARRIATLTKQVEDETARIEKQRSDERKDLEDARAQEREDQINAEAQVFADGLQKQFDALTSSLDQQKTSYKQFAQDVNAILATIGVPGFDPNADDEIAITTGPVASNVPHRKKKKGRAVGGGIWDGGMYRVGELGAEDVFLPRGSRVRQASETAAGGRLFRDLVVHNNGDALDEGALASKLAWQVTRGR